MSDQTLEATLPGDCYLTDSWFEREARELFHREWFCVGRRAGLTAQGDYRLVSICGESILLVCDGDGVNAFHNVCRHRGAQLVAAPTTGERSGQFQAGIRCPYHSWNYALNGDLHSTPHLDIDKSCFGLHQAAVDEWGGYVFVRLADDGASLQECMGDGVERIQRYPLADLHVGARYEYEVAANWKVLLENYNECYHCAGVHPELCKIVPEFRKNGGMDLDWEHGIPQREGTNTFTFTGTTNRAPFPGLNDDEKERHKGELFYPNLAISLSMDHASSYVLWPRDPHHTTIICEILFHPDEIAKPDFDPSDAAEFWHLVNQQDWQICESVQRGMGSTRFESGFYAPMEDWSLDIRNYVTRHLGDIEQ